ncbi:MAG: hypothetical protein JJ979_25890, partial [Roseibium sp.]|nr:hypothetical protein [Roseibium sp.]
GPGFVAQWATPGLVPAIIKTADGAPKPFADEQSAEFAALQQVAYALNNRRRLGVAHVNTPMNPNDFAADLAGLNITLAEFASLYGVKPERVVGWINGERDVPHAARVMLGLLAMPGNLDKAREISMDARVN